jgi:coenzyme F420-0:L-glutamate ligase / coenzyme F420-1:gamma-L-glutamate ligase
LKRVQVIPVPGLPEITPGADLGDIVVKALGASNIHLMKKDVIVVKQKVVSKAEGRLVSLAGVRPSRRAFRLAKGQSKDPRLVELVLRESVRVVRAGHGVIITETRHGFVCANSGVDQSNVPDGLVALLPLDPDRSARSLLDGLESATVKPLAVVISDTFGRPWRRGQTDVAIGCAGMVPLVSYLGMKDRNGYELRVTEPAVVDEIAGAAELAVGKLKWVPVAVVRGVDYTPGSGGVKSLIMERQRDLFR